MHRYTGTCIYVRHVMRQQVARKNFSVFRDTRIEITDQIKSYQFIGDCNLSSTELTIEILAQKTFILKHSIITHKKNYKPKSFIRRAVPRRPQQHTTAAGAIA